MPKQNRRRRASINYQPRRRRVHAASSPAANANVERPRFKLRFRLASDPRYILARSARLNQNSLHQQGPLGCSIPLYAAKYNKARHLTTAMGIYKRQLPCYIVAMMARLVREGKDPAYSEALTVSHLCHNHACVLSEHLVLEPMAVNNDRNRCRALKCDRCGHVMYSCTHNPKCLLVPQSADCARCMV